ncbi:MAG: hypothetical protein BWX80_03199 [Candidatus Hydrogenedentes bacterium ADurb.Bin101]|nr:MAG: hypothetical protein BWX80_03199 [Candidatus Hydrogenedentes bacterium ADurb.Bin101]
MQQVRIRGGEDLVVTVRQHRYGAPTSLQRAPVRRAVDTLRQTADDGYAPFRKLKGQFLGHFNAKGGGFPRAHNRHGILVFFLQFTTDVQQQGRIIYFRQLGRIGGVIHGTQGNLQIIHATFLQIEVIYLRMLEYARRKIFADNISQLFNGRAQHPFRPSETRQKPDKAGGADAGRHGQAQPVSLFLG